MSIDDYCNRHRKKAIGLALAGAMAFAGATQGLVSYISEPAIACGQENKADIERVKEVRAQKKRAIIVCQDLIAFDDARLMSDLLAKRGYSVSYIGTKLATEKEIFGALERVAFDSAEGDKTFFYFAGHGNNYYEGILQGICVNEKTSEGEDIIRPVFLLDRFARIRGQKAIAFNCCHSGVHTEAIDYNQNVEPILDDLRDYVIITACPKDKLNIYSPDYLDGKSIGSLTYGLYNVLKSGKEVNLSKENIECGTEFQRTRTKEYAESVGLKADEISFEMQRRSDCDFILEGELK